LKKKYHQNGIKIILGVFGDLEYPVRLGQNFLTCAQKLADDVIKYEFDIESYRISPRSIANMIISLKTKIVSKLLVVTP
jgi:hypothetical protein